MSVSTGATLVVLWFIPLAVLALVEVNASVLVGTMSGCKGVETRAEEGCVDGAVCKARLGLLGGDMGGGGASVAVAGAAAGGGVACGGGVAVAELVKMLRGGVALGDSGRACGGGPGADEGSE